MRKLIIIFFLFVSSFTFGQYVYYVQDPAYDVTYSSTASDGNAGTVISLPWATWNKAFQTVTAGDTVYFRGGMWQPITYVIYDGSGHSGTPGHNIVFINYPGEIPILDFSNYPYTGDAAAIDIRGVDHAEFIGLIFQNNKQRAFNEWISGVQIYQCGWISFNKVISRYHGGYGFEGLGYDTAYFYNCDSYGNIDSISDTPGNRADGWALATGGTTADTFKLTVMDGCRSWLNSDDGFEFGTSKQIQVNNCWSFLNGRESDGAGTGFKFSGGSQLTMPSKRKIYNSMSVCDRGECFADLTLNNAYYGPVHDLSNNLAYKGGAENGFAASPDVFNCNTGYANAIYRNNIAYGMFNQSYLDICINQTPDYPQYTIDSNNTWIRTQTDYYWAVNPDLTVTDDDFQVTDSSTIVNQLKSERKLNGELPDFTALRLTEGSDLIDAGTYVGQGDPDHVPIGVNWAYLDNGSPPQPPSTGHRISKGSNGRLLISKNNHILYLP